VHVWDIRHGKLARFRQFIDTVNFAEVVPAASRLHGRSRRRIWRTAKRRGRRD
jgi:hypothetical protein